MKWFLKITAVLCVLITESSARECTPFRTNNSEAFDYMSTVIDSFGYLRAATKELHEQSEKAQNLKEPDAVSQMSDLLRSMKRAAEDYECAATLVGGFGKSKDDTIATSAKSTFVMYHKLMGLNAEMLTLLRQVLDGKISASAMADKTSSNSVERDETYRKLIQSTSLGTYALVVIPTNDKETTTQLNITAPQRKELTTKLERIYGLGIQKGFFAGLKLVDSPAYLIYEFLSNDWRLAPK